jgi:membrane-bound lytic murein transglycosylase A
MVGLLAIAGAARAQDRGLDGIDVDPLGVPDTQLEPVAWTDVDGWASDDQAAAFPAFMTSCRPFLVRKREPADGRPIFKALWHVCRRAAAAGPLGADTAKARAFFEDNFEPVRIARLGETSGLLTGYYEPVVDGSRFPNPEFHTPIYRRPPDLVAESRPKAKSKTGAAAAIPNRGPVGRLNARKKLEPYYDRGAIEAGALDGKKLEICWIREPFDLMNIQIQGSARVRLEDGTMLRVGYDGHNGYSYSAVGRVLVERNLVPREEMSMERIRQWMHSHPDEAKEVRQTNRSYVFFRVTGLSDDGEPTGAQGVPLTAGRSIAVDKMHVFGTPFFIQAELPVDGARATTRFRRLMIAQDAGSAINGPARADLFWGAGDEAAKIAGRIRQQGRFVMLIPRELDMVEAGRNVPVPLPKPAVGAAAGDAKTDAKAKNVKATGGAGKGEGKSQKPDDDAKANALPDEKAQPPQAEKAQKAQNAKDQTPPADPSGAATQGTPAPTSPKPSESPAQPKPKAKPRRN